MARPVTEYEEKPGFPARLLLYHEETFYPFRYLIFLFWGP